MMEDGLHVAVQIMNSKRAKALRQAIREFSRAAFNGKAANDAYLRPDPKGPITLDKQGPRFIYQRAKKNV